MDGEKEHLFIQSGPEKPRQPALSNGSPQTQSAWAMAVIPSRANPWPVSCLDEGPLGVAAPVIKKWPWLPFSQSPFQPTMDQGAKEGACCITAEENHQKSGRPGAQFARLLQLTVRIYPFMPTPQLRAVPPQSVQERKAAGSHACR